MNRKGLILAGVMVALLGLALGMGLALAAPRGEPKAAAATDQSNTEISAALAAALAPYLSPLLSTTVDSTGNVGRHTSLAIGVDGLPVISYYDFTNQDLKVLHCGNGACTVGNTITTVDSTDNMGAYSSIAIGSDGLPVISYYNGTNGALKVAHCSNVRCDGVNIFTIVDFPYNPGSVGWYTSIAIGSDGLPVISYYDQTNGDLRVAHCSNVTCNTGNLIFALDSTGNVGLYTSIAIGSDGLPIISYYDQTNGRLKVARCGNETCSSGNTIFAVDAINENVGAHSSIAIGSDGLPVISYYQATTGDLKVLHCSNPTCSMGNTVVTLDHLGDVGQYTSIAIGSDGLPVISYYDVTNRNLKMVHCGNALCNSGNAITPVDRAGDVGQYTSIAIGADGLPIISYYQATTGDLKVLHCARTGCIVP